MKNSEVSQPANPPESESIGKLILKYSLPAIASSLVSSVYNIVDQMFVGNKIGEMGNAATNVAFPLVMIVTTLAMTFGAGSSASFSLYLGRKEDEKAKSVVGNGMTLMISCMAFLCFQLFPRQIISVFGKGEALYYEFALRYFHIFLFCTFIVGAQILSAQFFPSIGKGGIGTIVSLSRQVFFLLPLMIVFPLFWGIDGALWAGPIADGLSGILALSLVKQEMKKW